jgi:hypothetical protein
MNHITQLIDSYIAIWNETDATRRRDLIERTWTETGRYLDPLMQATGHAELEAIAQGVQTQFPGFQFRRTSEVDTHNDRVRFSWELGPANAPGVAGGVDFGVIIGGRLQTITGFLDFAPGVGG